MAKSYNLKIHNSIVPVLSDEDVFAGKLLDEGAFCTIKQVRKVQHKLDVAHNQGDFPYVLKQVKDDLSVKDRPYAVKDLQNEAQILSLLAHPNIIQIHGVGEIDDDSKSFLLLEKLSCTLEIKFQIWLETKKELKSQFIGKNKNGKAALWNERIVVAKEFASAMAYLHDLNILHRDLKLGNCGFGANSQFKLFDFGLATKLTQDKRVASNQYKLTGFTGTRRYMAPEIFKCTPYGKPADVYSYALILWEIMSLKIIFADESDETLANNVHGEMNFRPVVKKNWPSVFQKLIHESWSSDPSERPSFVDIQSILQQSQC